MVAVVIIFVIISVIAALASAVFGLDFDTVFFWCVIVVCCLVLLVFLNPLYWRAYREAREAEKRKREVVMRDWRRMSCKELRRMEKKVERELDREIDDYLENGQWQHRIGGDYERYSPTKGYQRISAQEYNDLPFKW